MYKSQVLIERKYITFNEELFGAFENIITHNQNKDRYQ